MDIGLFFKDLFTFNRKSLLLRWRRLSGLIKRKTIGQKSANVNWQEIPVIINNRNRLTYLLQLVHWLENAGMKKIIILDNDSTYPPLLDYYKTTSHRVIKLNENVGHLALWKSSVYKEFVSQYYIYTDPDLVPIDRCPKDVVKFLLSKLDQYSSPEKIGLGLQIDDLPDHYANKEQVLKWEKRYWTNAVDETVFAAEVDTTFALYRPFTNGAQWVSPAYRTNFPYVAKHLPWYENTADPGEENNYYASHVRQGASHWIERKENQ
jgi:hypothetical protein